MNRKTDIIIKIVLVVLALITVIGFSYAFMNYSLTGNKKVSITSGDIRVSLDETKTLANIISNNAMPISDADGKKTDPYTFSIINDSDTDLNYTIYVVNDSTGEKLPTNFVKLFYTRDNGDIKELKNLSSTDVQGDIQLETGIIPRNTTFNYTLRMWIDKEADNSAIGKNFSCHIRVDSSTVLNDVYADNSGAATPELKEGLIPVTIADDGTVKKADTKNKWYDYENKEWANAVILKDESVIYDNNQVIPEENIESYFVWVPRYRYRLWNTGTPSKTIHSIEIQFENNKQATQDAVNGECTTPMTSGETGACVNGDYMTHPAFLSLDVNGFWVGKFETGYDGATSTAAAQVNASSPDKVIIKPNVFSWRNITVGNIFTTVYNYKRDMDSHMMKNTEWGAVAYLSHSKYGKNYDININNNSSYKTGFSAIQSTAQLTYPGISGDGPTFNFAYNTETGYLATTTGNISGIYDISGGAHEYVAGYVIGYPGSSGFNPTTYDLKYFDQYKASTTYTDWNRRILGDATGEMGPFRNFADGDNSDRYHSSWYSEYSYLAYNTSPWFYRGGYYHNGGMAGAFFFSLRTGAVSTYLGFRVVLD